jgi:hypothetical protein
LAEELCESVHRPSARPHFQITSPLSLAPGEDQGLPLQLGRIGFVTVRDLNAAIRD